MFKEDTKEEVPQGRKYSQNARQSKPILTVESTDLTSNITVLGYCDLIGGKGAC
jgi:hypothetical protein